MPPLASKSFLQRCQSSLWLRVFSGLTCALVPGPLALQAASIPADKSLSYPGWWFERGVIQPLDANNPNPLWATGGYPSPDDFAAANLGQLKQIATAAYDELNAWLPGGAGPQVESLVKGWFQLDPGTGDFLLDAQGHRQPKVTAPTNNYAAVNLGQIKAVAQPFYDRLIALHYQPAYPWANKTPDDYAAANLGQIKNLFSFGPDRDTDGDGIPDWWENLYGLNPQDPSDASQTAQAGDMSNADKYQKNLDPSKADFDNDGVPDINDIDPLDPDLRQPRVPESNYAVIELNAIDPNNPFKGVSCINDSLQMLDNAQNPPQQARLWTHGTFQPIVHPRLATLNAWTKSLSNNGEVVDPGDYWDTNERTFAVWSPAGPKTMHYHDTVVDGYSNKENDPSAWRISPSGYIMGASWGSGNDTDPQTNNVTALTTYYNGFVMNAATEEATVVGDVIRYDEYPDGFHHTSGQTALTPNDMNSWGFVVGAAGGVDDFSLRAAFWFETTEYLSQDPGSYATSINDAAPPIAVGVAGPTANKAVMWAFLDDQGESNAKQKDLGAYDAVTGTRSPVYGKAYKINDRCEIIGDFRDAQGYTIGRFWQNGRIVDLNTRITDNRYQLQGVNDINNDGVILASATRITDNATVQVLLLPIQIQDDNAAGTLGDNIPSNHGSKGEKHFVSPKKSTDGIPDDYVDFKVTGIPQVLFQQFFKWDTDQGAEAHSDPLKYHVKRDAPLKCQLRIKRKSDDSLVDKMNAWIVWTQPRLVNKGIAGFEYRTPVENGAGNGFVYATDTDAAKAWRFVFVIQPPEIIAPDEAERPELGGTASKPVPGRDLSNPYFSGAPDAAEMKWDVSRQIRATIHNTGPTRIPLGQLNKIYPAGVLQGQPSDMTIGREFPSNDDAAGNDDIPGLHDEEDDPYHRYTGDTDPATGVAFDHGLGHEVGELSSCDAPAAAVADNWGAAGRSFSYEDDFREFSRLELWDRKRTDGKFWFRISDYYKWHFYLRVHWDSDSNGTRWFDNASPQQSSTDLGNQ